MNNNPRLTTQVELAVPFHDVDMMGVVWHGNYFRYLEIAREKLLSQFNYGYAQMRESGYAWPVVDSRIKYRHPLAFEQKFRVEASVEEYENRLKIQYKIFDCETGKCTTSAYTIQVAVNMETKELCYVSPAILFDCIGVKP